MSAYNFLSNEFHITVNNESKTLTVTDVKWGGIFSSNNRGRSEDASELLVAIGEGVYDTVEVVNDDVLYKVEFTTFVRVELRDIAREAEEAEEALFINISDGYGNPEIVTVSDYQELNPDAIFEINGDEIWEVDADGRCVEVVARAEETEEAVEADDDDFSDWVEITPRPATAIAKLNEEIPYVLTHNDSGYQDEVTPPRWVATWVMDTWVETYTFRAHLEFSAPGYPTEATAIALMAGDEPAPFENSAGGEDRWTLQTLDLSRCHFENGHWYAN